MKRAADPVGDLNDATLLDVARDAGVVIAAWGAHGTWLKRDEYVRFLLRRRLHYLRLTKDGHPGHPLYLPANLRPVAWWTSGGEAR